MAKRGSMVSAAHAAMREKRAELDKIGVELQVRDAEHVKSPEVIEFSLKHLSAGGTWEELRRKLGLGPAHLDQRWRRLRHLLVEGLAPQTEEEALRAQADGRAFLLLKVQEFEETMDFVLQETGRSDEDKKALPSLLKLKLEAIKLQLDENSRGFDAYVNLKKAKETDKKGQGPSVLIQNNYHIARPGDDKKELKDVTATAVALAEGKRAASGD